MASETLQAPYIVSSGAASVEAPDQFSSSMDLNSVDLCDCSTASRHLISDDLHASELGKDVKVRVTGK